MKRALIPAFLLLLGSTVLGATVLREPLARAAVPIASVFVTNDDSNPVPVREQNLDGNGNLKVHEQGTAAVHEQGTANVNVTNRSLSITPEAPITGGGYGFGARTGTSVGVVDSVATALSIHLTEEVSYAVLSYQGSEVAAFYGPASAGGGNPSVFLPLTRPILFDRLQCDGSAGGWCKVSWVGAKP
jgi:hypothetical protein